jgi:hypothetical protein
VARTKACLFRVGLETFLYKGLAGTDILRDSSPHDILLGSLPASCLFSFLALPMKERLVLESFGTLS